MGINNGILMAKRADTLATVRTTASVGTPAPAEAMTTAGPKER